MSSFLQLLFNGLIAGSLYILVAVGFAFVFTALRFFHLAHAAVVAIGAYVVFALSHHLGGASWYAVLAGITACGLVGCGVELVVYRPLRARRASSSVLLLASLGIYIVLQNAISIAFGDDAKSIWTVDVKPGFRVLGAYITPLQIIIILTAFAVLFVVGLFLRFSIWGKAMRAMADDRNLAIISGVNVDHIALFAFATGSALAGVAGILQGMDTALTPEMGLNLLLLGVIAFILGGERRISGIAVAAPVLGIAQQCAAWYIGPSWQDAIAFVILLLLLLMRPAGLLGKKHETTRKAGESWTT